MKDALDYNLIKFLVAIIDTHSMTQAAEFLGVAPSAVSYAVAKLRDHYQDPLFVRVKNGVIPTPLALSLYERFKPLNDEMHLAFKTAKNSSPARRVIRIRTNPIIEFWISYYALKSGLLTADLRLDFICTSTENDSRINRLRKRDIHLDIGFALTHDNNITSRQLVDLTYNIVCHSEHPRIGDHISLEEFLREQHVTWTSMESNAEMNSGDRSFMDASERLIQIKSESLMIMVMLAIHSELLTVVPAFLSPLLRDVLGAKVLSAPFLNRQGPKIYAFVHKSDRHDPVLNSLIELFNPLNRGLPESAG